MGKTKSHTSWVIGGSYKIESLKGHLSVVHRLNELGFIEGREFDVLYKTPFNGPIIVDISGTLIALRNEEIECLQT